MIMSCRERQTSAKNMRQKEKKLKDYTFQLEDERKQAQQYREQVTLLTINETNAPSSSGL